PRWDRTIAAREPVGAAARQQRPALHILVVKCGRVENRIAPGLVRPVHIQRQPCAVAHSHEDVALFDRFRLCAALRNEGANSSHSPCARETRRTVSLRDHRQRIRPCSYNFTIVKYKYLAQSCNPPIDRERPSHIGRNAAVSRGAPPRSITVHSAK